MTLATVRYGQGGDEALHTSYGDHWFHSGLEAKWAFTFDKLGLHWHYEPAKLRHGESHLSYFEPDFFIDEWDSYVEIKPREEHTQKLRHTLPAYASSHRRFTCLLIVGSPGATTYDISFYEGRHRYHDTSGWLLGDDGHQDCGQYLVHPERRPIRLNIEARRARDPLQRSFRRISRNLFEALSSGQAGPPQIRKGQFIHPRTKCPLCRSNKGWFINHLGKDHYDEMVRREDPWLRTSDQLARGRQ